MQITRKPYIIAIALFIFLLISTLPLTPQTRIVVTTDRDTIKNVSVETPKLPLIARLFPPSIGKGAYTIKVEVSKNGIVVFNSTLKDVAEKIFHSYSKKVKFAKITGPSSKFPNQKVGLKHVVKDKDIVEDLINESEQGFDLCKSTLKSISNMRNNLVIMLSNRLNKTISTLTILTVIITIPAAISGIYGMNLRLPLQQNPFAFFYILGFIIVSWTLFFVYFKARRII